MDSAFPPGEAGLSRLAYRGSEALGRYDHERAIAGAALDLATTAESRTDETVCREERTRSESLSNQVRYDNPRKRPMRPHESRRMDRSGGSPRASSRNNSAPRMPPQDADSASLPRSKTMKPISGAPISYELALRAQEALVALRRDDRLPDTLWVLEHRPVITFGTSGGEDHLLLAKGEIARRGFEIHPTRRGGDVSCHEPGQLVGHPIVSPDAPGDRDPDDQPPRARGAPHP